MSETFGKLMYCQFGGRCPVGGNCFDSFFLGQLDEVGKRLDVKFFVFVDAMLLMDSLHREGGEICRYWIHYSVRNEDCRKPNYGHGWHGRRAEKKKDGPPASVFG